MKPDAPPANPSNQGRPSRWAAWRDRRAAERRIRRRESARRALASAIDTYSRWSFGSSQLQREDDLAVIASLARRYAALGGDPREVERHYNNGRCGYGIEYAIDEALEETPCATS